MAGDKSARKYKLAASYASSASYETLVMPLFLRKLLGGKEEQEVARAFDKAHKMFVQ